MTGPGTEMNGAAAMTAEVRQVCRPPRRSRQGQPSSGVLLAQNRTGSIPPMRPPTLGV